MGEITDIPTLTRELQKEKMTLVNEIKELKEEMVNIEKQIRYLEGAEDSIDVTLKLIRATASGNKRPSTNGNKSTTNGDGNGNGSTRRGWKTTRKTTKKAPDEPKEELEE